MIIFLHYGEQLPSQNYVGYSGFIFMIKIPTYAVSVCFHYAIRNVEKEMNGPKDEIFCSLNAENV